MRGAADADGDGVAVEDDEGGVARVGHDGPDGVARPVAEAKGVALVGAEGVGQLLRRLQSGVGVVDGEARLRVLRHSVKLAQKRNTVYE